MALGNGLKATNLSDAEMEQKRLERLITFKSPGAIPVFRNHFSARLAQLEERLPYKQHVGGSSPSSRTIYVWSRRLKVRILGFHPGDWSSSLHGTAI